MMGENCAAQFRALYIARMTSLSAAERSRRLYGDALRQLRKKGKYERTASVEELLKDLAVIRAIPVAAHQRRSLFIGLMVAVVIISAFVAGNLRHDAFAPFIVMLPVLFVLWLLRRFTRPWNFERIDYAMGLLRRLDVIGLVTVSLDVRPSFRREFKQKTQPGLYVQPWFSLKAPLATSNVHVTRVERCNHSVIYGGNRTTTRWAFSSDDRFTIEGAGSEIPMVPPIALPPEGFSGVSTETGPGRATLGVNYSLSWGAPPSLKERSLDAVEMTLAWLAHLAGSLRTPPVMHMHTVDAPHATVWPVGTNGLGWVTLALALGSLALPVAYLVDNGPPQEVQRVPFFLLMFVPMALLSYGVWAWWALPRRRALKG